MTTEHLFLIAFQFVDKMVNIINNLTLPENLVQEMAIVIPYQYIFPNTYLIYIYTKLKTNQNHFYQR